MEKLNEQITVDDVPATNPETFEVRSEMLTSTAVCRLLDEVRCDELTGYSAMQRYDRDHNRHNR